MSGSAGIAEAPTLTPARKRWTLLAVILGSGIVFLDTSVVNLALPRIGEDLSSDLFGTLEAQSYVANAYFVTLSALLILAGALSDYFGRRRMFAIGLIGFAATSPSAAAHGLPTGDRAGLEVVHDDRRRLRWAPDQQQAQGDQCDQRGNSDRAPAAPELAHGAAVVNPIGSIPLIPVPNLSVLVCSSHGA